VDQVPDTNLAAEVERLHALLDIQPSCLMRVSVDGIVLAASDAAISLLGAQRLAQVLDSNLLDRLEGEREPIWADFVERVRQGGSASAECEMNDLAGVRRAVVLQGALLPVHPDAVESMVVVARDVSTARRLEASLREQEELRRVAQDDLRAAVEQIAALEARLDAVTALAQQVVEKGRHS
jgi:hypothetical protein